MAYFKSNEAETGNLYPAAEVADEEYDDGFDELNGEEELPEITEEEKKEESLSKEEWEIYFCVNDQYQMEANRIVKVMEKLIKKGKEIATTAESLTKEETDKKQVELLILLEEAKDKSNMDAEQMLRTAMNIHAQTQLNVLQGPEMNN